MNELKMDIPPDFKTGSCDIRYIEDKYNRVRSAEAKYALILLNIKNFRYYNTKYSIEDGNEILELLLQAISGFLGENEYAGHLYADNFVILLKYEDIDSLVYGRMMELIEITYRIDDYRIYRNIFYSMGIYQIEDSHTSFHEAFNFANISRKESGSLLKRNVVMEIYDQNFYNHFMERMELETRTAEAYKEYEFVSFLQPKVDMETEEIIGAEALLRWFDEDGNSVPLFKFLPILNDNGYIELVDLDMFDRLCELLDNRIKNNQKIVPISFNVSKTNFYSPNVLDDYKKIFEKYNIPKEFIQIEFMESISLNDTAHMKKVISGFKDYGFTCVLDDFGNGYSSFNVLLNAPLDIIKMDRQFFVENLNGDGKLVIKTVIDLIHSLNMEVVAEGVETKEHIEYLRTCQCDYVQGYYYYKPMAVEAFWQLLDIDTQKR